MLGCRAVPPARKPLTVQVAVLVADEIGDAARRTRRSVAFIVRRALGAAPNAQVVPEGERVALQLTTDEDDPADTLSKIKAHGQRDLSLDDAVAAAWLATRARFQAWIAREEDAARAEDAHDLDTELKDAGAPSTTVARLIELSKSEYPKVRALVAVHASTPPEVLKVLATDREPYVRDATENRRLKGS
jgi:hypothetical protein